MNGTTGAAPSMLYAPNNSVPKKRTVLPIIAGSILVASSSITILSVLSTELAPPNGHPAFGLMLAVILLLESTLALIGAICAFKRWNPHLAFFFAIFSYLPFIVPALVACSLIFISRNEFTDPQEVKRSWPVNLSSSGATSTGTYAPSSREMNNGTPTKGASPRNHYAGRFKRATVGMVAMGVVMFTILGIAYISTGELYFLIPMVVVVVTVIALFRALRRAYTKVSEVESSKGVQPMVGIGQEAPVQECRSPNEPSPYIDKVRQSGNEIDKGIIIYEEKLYPGYQPSAPYHYGYDFGAIYVMRIGGLFFLLMFILTVEFHITDEPGTNILQAFLLLILIPFMAIMMLIGAELVYVDEALTPRPLFVFSNGLEIAPIYFQKYTKKKGFIDKERIDRIEIRNRFQLTAWLAERDFNHWHHAKLEFVVHLKNGRKRRSGKKPPETVKEIVDLMHKQWGIPVVNNSKGNGWVEIHRDFKLMEERDL